MLSPSRRTTSAILRVHFQPQQSIDDMHALALQLLRPLNVALFIEARL